MKMAIIYLFFQKKGDIYSDYLVSIEENPSLKCGQTRTRIEGDPKKNDWDI